MTDDFLTDELLRCPFCGGRAAAYEIPAHTHLNATFLPDYEGGAFAECMKCDIVMGADTLAEVIAMWNTRCLSGTEGNVRIK